MSKRPEITEYERRLIREALKDHPMAPVHWKSEITREEVWVGRARERQLIEEAERIAAQRRQA